MNFPHPWFRTYTGKFVSCAPQMFNIWKANKGNAKYISTIIFFFFNAVGFLSQCNVYRGGTELSYNFQEFAFTFLIHHKVLFLAWDTVAQEFWFKQFISLIANIYCFNFCFKTSCKMEIQCAMHPVKNVSVVLLLHWIYLQFIIDKDGLCMGKRVYMLIKPQHTV